MKKTILVFGVSGFIGINFGRYREKYMPKEGYKVIGVTSKATLASLSGIDYLEKTDSLDSPTINKLIEKYRPEYILNLVGVFGDAGFKDLIEANVEVSHNILQAIVNIGVLKTRVLFIGSAAEYGMVEVSPVSEESPLKPVTLYGLSKVFQTKLARFYYETYNVQSIVARTFNLTGRGISPLLSVGSFQSQIDAANDGDSVKVGNLDSERDFLDIEKAIETYITLLHYGVAGEVYNVCSGRSIRVGDVLESMILNSGKKLNVETKPKLSSQIDIRHIYGSREKFDHLLKEIPKD